MRNVSAVIGANFGDEGKGHITDYLAAKDPLNTLVVRFNGGAQAGHTVVDPKGRRHVFHHFGSGTYAGAGTYLSSYFVVNPMVFVPEFDKLNLENTIPPIVVCDPNCLVTTPYDAMLNQAIEKQRGAARHGSCGLGVWETIVRGEDPAFRLRASELLDHTLLLKKLKLIREKWVPARALSLGLEDEIPHLMDDRIIHHFIEDSAVFAAVVVQRRWNHDYAVGWERLVFEGAQGLALDKDRGFKPYVSTSNTGLKNVRDLLLRAELTDSLNVYYCTRPYLTRHGAGPLSQEIEKLPYTQFEDKTNVENPWQGKLRFAWHDVLDLAAGIEADLRLRPQDVFPHLAITCIDQVRDENITWSLKGEQKITSLAEFINAVCTLTKIPIWRCLFGTGPNRKDTEEFDGAIGSEGRAQAVP